MLAERASGGWWFVIGRIGETALSARSPYLYLPLPTDWFSKFDLLVGPTAVYGQALTGDVAAILRGEEREGGFDRFGVLTAGNALQTFDFGQR